MLLLVISAANFTVNMVSSYRMVTSVSAATRTADTSSALTAPCGVTPTSRTNVADAAAISCTKLEVGILAR